MAQVRNCRAPVDAERGATALEFALLAPVLFLLLFAGLETGRLLFLAAAFRSAVADAARCAELDRPQCRTLPGLAAEVEARIAALGMPVAVPADALRAEAAPCGVRIVARMPYPPLLLPRAAAPMLAAEACAPSSG